MEIYIVVISVLIWGALAAIFILDYLSEDTKNE